MEISPKWLIVQGVIAFACAFGYGIRKGREHKVTKSQASLDDHQYWLIASLWVLTFTVIGIVALRYSLGPIPRPALFFVHLPLVLIATGIIFAIVVRFDGIRAKHVHGKLGYSSAACFGLGLISGLHMLYYM